MSVCVEKSAELSECGNYRYSLTRRWGSGPRFVNWIMLNPSTADADKDDATVRKCISFSKRWGFDGLVITNLFAYRATDPKELYGVGVLGAYESRRHVRLRARECELVMCAWGNHGKLYNSGKMTRKALEFEGLRLHYLKLNNSGEPAHPLYLSGTAEPQPWCGLANQDDPDEQRVGRALEDG